ncbi:hypothetical protein Tco_1360394 [Tanacetum coccineum]
MNAIYFIPLNAEKDSTLGRDGEMYYGQLEEILERHLYRNWTPHPLMMTTANANKAMLKDDDVAHVLDDDDDALDPGVTLQADQDILDKLPSTKPPEHVGKGQEVTGVLNFPQRAFLSHFQLL